MGNETVVARRRQSVGIHLRTLVFASVTSTSPRPLPAGASRQGHARMLSMPA
jgi:hypothetical protein